MPFLRDSDAVMKWIAALGVIVTVYVLLPLRFGSSSIAIALLSRAMQVLIVGVVLTSRAIDRAPECHEVNKGGWERSIDRIIRRCKGFRQL